ncbi:UNVERIFIED_CONTAM: hypothetical protein Scaly_3026000 [Sesamum calycinum]|uniref:GRAM domain-containing protein n=1 Tax=Sesamum calycinum TaxID=2727403 RepID=A0AAW2K8T9_9LAMI
MFVLARDGVEFEIDKIPGTQGGTVKARGTIYLSNIRMVFVASKPVENFVAFDLPLNSMIFSQDSIGITLLSLGEGSRTGLQAFTLIWNITSKCIAQEGEALWLILS